MLFRFQESTENLGQQTLHLLFVLRYRIVMEEQNQMITNVPLRKGCRWDPSVVLRAMDGTRHRSWLWENFATRSESCRINRTSRRLDWNSRSNLTFCVTNYQGSIKAIKNQVNIRQQAQVVFTWPQSHHTFFPWERWSLRPLCDKTSYQDYSQTMQTLAG